MHGGGAVLAKSPRVVDLRAYSKRRAPFAQAWTASPTVFSGCFCAAEGPSLPGSCSEPAGGDLRAYSKRRAPFAQAWTASPTVFSGCFCAAEGPSLPGSCSEPAGGRPACVFEAAGAVCSGADGFADGVLRMLLHGGGAVLARKPLRTRGWSTCVRIRSGGRRLRRRGRLRRRCSQDASARRRGRPCQEAAQNPRVVDLRACSKRRAPFAQAWTASSTVFSGCFCAAEGPSLLGSRSEPAGGRPACVLEAAGAVCTGADGFADGVLRMPRPVPPAPSGPGSAGGVRRGWWPGSGPCAAARSPW
ncbi:hypothetical protein ATL45_2222 [Saccharopolyspora antimicrobica]|uniref:Uncharacterized protein n=1 Tax=Saccharopolyspora antimicrobica TaxID=455193 RepID=A0ABX9TA78_9PSEU|nr:hypothetical protein ATL45_2222 [Saccharopolyspora antimicrobica]